MFLMTELGLQIKYEKRVNTCMWLNASTDYAIRMLICLSRTSGAVSSSKLARAIGVSPRYLLQIGARLRDAGFVSVSFGAAGGYRLSRLPGEISLLDVITAMEGRQDLSECRSCIKEKQEFRLLRHVYEELEIGITRQLQSVTICELLPEE